jgi:predicted dehydrogenase
VVDEVRVGIIGTGFGATNVLPAFETVKDCTVVDIVTPRDDAAVAALCARADVDVISVHSPPFLHLPHVRLAVDAGHAVHCDKPFGRNADEAAQMTELAEGAGVVNLLNFERRFDPARERMRELVRDRAVGEPSHFQYTRLLAVPDLPWTWLNDRSLGGGWLGGQGSHLIDCCRWLFDTEIVEADAVMRVTVPERADKDGTMHPCDAEDGFVATLKTENGVTGVIDAAIGAAVTTAEHTAVFGTTGMLQIEGEQVVLRKADGDVETHDVDMQGKTPLVRSMERWAERVCDAVRRGAAEPGWPTFADGLATAVVMDRMRA